LGVLEAIDSWPVPNVAAVVVGPGGVLESRGELDRQFRTASVAKLPTCYAIMIAVEEGVVGLDDEAGPAGSTLRHLLAHTSGYGFDTTTVLARPASRRIYSNRGIEEAAAYLAAAAGMRFEDYQRESVLDPLGLAATRLVGSPAHAMVSTAGDLAVFAAELLGPRLLTAQTLADMVMVHFPGLSGVMPGLGRYNPLDWGLGFERNFSRPGHWAGRLISGESFGHVGATGTFLWVDPVARRACVCLTDRDYGPWALQAWPALCDSVVTWTT
jgi:CubicO group peptidase (beta-lactamase class C family)